LLPRGALVVAREVGFGKHDADVGVGFADHVAVGEGRQLLPGDVQILRGFLHLAGADFSLDQQEAVRIQQQRIIERRKAGHAFAMNEHRGVRMIGSLLDVVQVVVDLRAANRGIGALPVSAQSFDVHPHRPVAISDRLFE
jgi:hypothetical protein